MYSIKKTIIDNKDIVFLQAVNYVFLIVLFFLVPIIYFDNGLVKDAIKYFVWLESATAITTFGFYYIPKLCCDYVVQGRINELKIICFRLVLGVVISIVQFKIFPVDSSVLTWSLLLFNHLSYAITPHWRLSIYGYGVYSLVLFINRFSFIILLFVVNDVDVLFLFFCCMQILVAFSGFLAKIKINTDCTIECISFKRVMVESSQAFSLSTFRILIPSISTGLYTSMLGTNFTVLIASLERFGRSGISFLIPHLIRIKSTYETKNMEIYFNYAIGFSMVFGVASCFLLYFFELSNSIVIFSVVSLVLFELLMALDNIFFRSSNFSVLIKLALSLITGLFLYELILDDLLVAYAFAIPIYIVLSCVDVVLIILRKKYA